VLQIILRVPPYCGTSAIVVVMGGAVVVTGGAVVVTGGAVVVTGGAVVVTGGAVTVVVVELGSPQADNSNDTSKTTVMTGIIQSLLLIAFILLYYYSLHPKESRVINIPRLASFEW